MSSQRGLFADMRPFAERLRDAVRDAAALAESAPDALDADAVLKIISDKVNLEKLSPDEQVNAVYWTAFGYLSAPRSTHAEADVVVWTDTVVNGVPLNITTRGSGKTDDVALSHLDALRRLASAESVHTFGVAQPTNKTVSLLKGESAPRPQADPPPPHDQTDPQTLPGERSREAVVIRKDKTQSGVEHIALVDAEGKTIGRVFFGKRGKTPMERAVAEMTPGVEWSTAPQGFSVPGQWHVFLRQSERVSDRTGEPYWDVVGIREK